MFKHIKHSQNGLTVTELIITIFVASIFVMAIYQLYTISVVNNVDSRRLSLANDMAYTELRKYPTAASIPSFTCNADTDKTNASYTGLGYTVSTSTVTSSTTLPNPVVTKISAFNPKGCSSALKEVTVTVSYGSTPVKQVRHSIYVK